MREYEDWLREEEETPGGCPEDGDPAEEALRLREETAACAFRTWEVPAVYDMDRCLRERFADGILALMNEYLVRGDLSEALGKAVVSARIAPGQLRLGQSAYWRLNRTDFLADVTVTADLAVEEKGQETTLPRAFCLSLWFGTDEGFRFEPHGICRAENRPERSFWKLDEHLVPVLRREETEEGAERLWKTYLPEASSPSERRAELLAAALGLRVRSLRLHGQNETKAVLFFRDSRVPVQPEKDPDAETVPLPVPTDVEAGTVVINTAAAHREGQAMEILHECIHFEWHRLFFLLQQTASTSPREIPTRKVQNSTGRRPRDPLHWMEKQAREGAMALLLPAREIRERAWRAFQKAAAFPSRSDYINHAGFRWQKAIREIRSEYASSGQTVPLLTVRRRLVSLGFESARGAVNYVDGRYITPFAFTAEYSERGQDTYVIRRKDMMDLYRRNRLFRERMGRGDFVWVDGHICVNDSQFLRLTREGARLTPWANAHVDACCLRFGREYLKERESVLVLGRAESSEEYNRQYNEYLDRRMTLTAGERAAKRDELMRHFPNTFSDALRYLMENRSGGRISVEELAAAAQVSRKTVERYRREDQRAYQEDKLIALCIALHLPPWLSRALLSRARVTVSNHGPRGYCGEILDCCFMDSVDDVQRYLEENGYPKLRLQDA